MTLRAAGVEPTGAERFLALTATMPTPTPLPNGRLLDLEPHALLSLAAEQAVVQLSREIATDRLTDLQRQVAAEMIIDCRAETDSYITTMRPAFDQAAGYASTLVKLGVASTDKPEFIARRGGKAVGAGLPSPTITSRRSIRSRQHASGSASCSVLRRPRTSTATLSTTASASALPCRVTCSADAPA